MAKISLIQKIILIFVGFLAAFPSYVYFYSSFEAAFTAGDMIAYPTAEKYRELFLKVLKKNLSFVIPDSIYTVFTVLVISPIISLLTIRFLLAKKAVFQKKLFTIPIIIAINIAGSFLHFLLLLISLS